MDFQGARRRMIESQVRTNDVSDLRIQAAIEAVPREIFLPVELRAQAYVERDIPYAPGRRMVAIRDLAKLVDAADPKAHEIVLDIACGTGYSTAVLAQLAEMVVAVESAESLVSQAQTNLESLAVTNAAVIAGPPPLGAEKQGPFDVIFIGGGLETEPKMLFAQLKEGGRLAALQRSEGVVRGVVYAKTGGSVGRRSVFDAASQAILPEFAAPRVFAF